MTLLIPLGEESLSCVSDCDDVDSGCLARSPDEIVKHDFGGSFDGPNVGTNNSPGIMDDEASSNKLRDEARSSLSTEERSQDPECAKKTENSDSTSKCDASASSPLLIYDCKVSDDSSSKLTMTSDGDKALDADDMSGSYSISEGCSSNIINSKNTSIDEGKSLQSYSEADTLKIQSFESRLSNKESNPSNSKLIKSSPVDSFSNNISSQVVRSNLCSDSNLNSEDNRKLKLRKLLQRRSVSESSTSEFEAMNQKRMREKLRHSFSSYENCDTYNEILEIGLEGNTKNNIENERLNNSINKILNKDNKDLDTNVNGASIEKVSRKSFEISDTLVNNVKKSMIEEYKKLKKRSSLANQSPNDHLSNTYRNINECNLNSNNEIKNEYTLMTVEETFEGPKVNGAEMGDQTHASESGSSNSIPSSEIRARTVSVRESSSVSVASETDFRRSKSFPLTDSVSNSYENNSKLNNVSSPPSRLELWKNILAEKRNSLKNHIKGLSRHADIKNNTGSCNNNKIQILSADVINSEESDVNDNEFSENAVNCELSSVEIKNDSRTVVNTNGCVNYVENENLICSTTNIPTNNNDSRNRHANEDNYSSNFLNLKYSEESHLGGESNFTDKPDRKSIIKEACEGIAKALDTIPDTQQTKSGSKEESEENLNNMKDKDEFSVEDSTESSDFVLCKDVKYANSNIASIITTILPPIYVDLASTEKGQQCPTPPVKDSEDEEELQKGRHEISNSSENESDYCQTDDCGDDCDYCSGDEAEDEEEDTCDACRRNCSVSSVCKHAGVMTNGSLRPLRKQLLFDDGGIQRLSGTRCLSLQAAFRRRHINHQELSAIREYSITSDEQQESEEEMSHDDSMVDISSSWRYGLCDEPPSNTLESISNFGKEKGFISTIESRQIAKLKSNSLPASTPRNQIGVELPKRPGSVVLKQTFHSEDDGGLCIAPVPGIRLPPRAPRSKKARHIILSASPPGISTSPPLTQTNSLRPTMGLQGLQQRPSLSKLAHGPSIPTGPKTLVPRSPLNPNPPYGFPSPPSPPVPSPGSPFQGRKSPLETSAAPPSPRTNSRSGALVTRNFSISDDEGGQRLSRRQVTITRHESAYKEAADKGYLLPPSSPIDPYWLTWKLGVLLKTVEEVGSRLEESEKVVGAWGPVPQDQNLAEQYVHNIRKFRETLPDLQRGIDDVNDQAARFSAHNVPLTPANSAALHDLNNRWKNLETNVNDRWRQVAGKSREVSPLTPAQLASSVTAPWERATATNKVPYYINHAQETTHWDHPQMMDLLDSLSEFNHIKFSAYRTATKLRCLQKKLALDRAKLQMVTDVFDEHGLRGQNDRLIDVNDMIVVLSTLYGRISSDNNDVNTTLTTDLCLNWLLNVYDSQRTGQMRVLSFRVGLICLCRGHLEEKYRYMFRLIADPNRLVDQRKLGLLLHDCVQVPRQLGEVAAFGGSNIEPSVRSCFTKAGKDRETIEAVHFLTWVQQEPQSLVWLAVLHRVAASESVQHQVKCNICKTSPIVGLRYRCLKCLSFDMCQRCFFEGRSTKSHKITHPMHEYCTETRAGDEMKDFTKALKNKFKSKRSLQKHTKKGYLPVQTVLEGDPIESPSPSPSHNVSSQDMHSRLELYASRLAEVELRTNSNSTPDSEDEHGLIAQYCQSLSSTDAPFPVPKSPLQIMASVDADQKDELEQMIRDLEEENRALQAEYERLKSEQPTGSTSEETLGQRSEAEMLAEAKLLREHKGRLEARMNILEDHNRQLEAQLQRLRQLLVEQQSGMGSPNKSGTLQTKSVTASQLAMDSPAKINGHSSQGGQEKLGVGNPGASTNRERVNDSLSEDQSDENDYDNTVSPHSG